MRFVVTGTGRNGTGYSARLFTAAGFACGHEDVFRAVSAIGERGIPRVGVISKVRAPIGRTRETLRRRRSEFVGDASWMATPRLERFSGVSFLQLRHPLPVIRSFMGTRFFSDTTRHVSQRRFAAAHFDISGDDVIDTMRWWVYWNDLAAAHADMVFPLERLDEETFARMLALIGAERAVAAPAMAAVPHDVNSSSRRGDTPGRLTWADLPAGPEKDRLEATAIRWGYDPGDEDVLPPRVPAPISGRDRR